MWQLTSSDHCQDCHLWGHWAVKQCSCRCVSISCLFSHDKPGTSTACDLEFKHCKCWGLFGISKEWTLTCDCVRERCWGQGTELYIEGSRFTFWFVDKRLLLSDSYFSIHETAFCHWAQRGFIKTRKSFAFPHADYWGQCILIFSFPKLPFS